MNSFMILIKLFKTLRLAFLSHSFPILVLFAFISFPVQAESSDLSIKDAWSRASIGTTRPGAAYLTIHNSGKLAATLTSVQTDIAQRSVIHRSTINASGVSSMAPAGEIRIDAGKELSLEPGGLHIMLMRLRRPLIEGNRYWLTLHFLDGSRISVEVPVLGIAARGPRH